jgi:hypothetical protein
MNDETEDREDGTLLPVRDEALPQRYLRAGTAALAEMSDSEFEIRLEAMRRGRERLARIHRELMNPDTDYGTIPGTPKPALLKSGAEKLAEFYRLASEFTHKITYCDDGTAPPITVVAECRLHLGTLDGPVVNTGHGAASSWEKRYRYRRGERACPNCGMIGSIIKGRAEWGGGWKCWDKKGGCGAKFGEGVPAIVDQVVGDVENPDPYDLLNTLLKMASKRSMVDAVLRATATSSTYTQDMEEAGAPEPPAPPREAPPRQTARVEEENPFDPFASEEPPRTPRQVGQPGNGHSQPAAEGALVCSQAGCGILLTKGQAMVSEKAYHALLCPDHQRMAARVG